MSVNIMAKEVRTPKYASRVVKPRKGKMSYTRKTKHKKNIINKE